MDELKMKTCCFTGHRDIPSDMIPKLTLMLRSELTDLIESGYCCFCAGGALGFDTIAAQTVLDLKKTYPHIKLILVLPCETQAKSWNTDDRRIYEDIKSKADEVIYTSREYYRGCMHKRNRHLVNCSRVCVCYLKKSSGGTAYTVDYARKKGCSVRNIAEYI